MARSSAQEEWGKWVADSDHIGHAAMRWGDADFRTLSEEDQFRLYNAVEAAFLNLDGVFYQYELGLIPEDYYRTTFRGLMRIWVPRWRESGFLEKGWMVPRPSFQAEIEKYLDEPLVLDSTE